MTLPAGEDDVLFLVLAPFQSHLDMMLYPTSRVVRAHCGHRAWLSPQGERMFETAYTICVDCQDASYRHEEALQIAVPGALNALTKLWGPDVAEEIRREMQRRGVTPQE